ncbi:MAG: isoprenoid biosynthesis glyoxalase ElbB, partial [Deltaproteobacteria bacterium]|nr:isoprenoid biosynthesis glyoxalase ElbB [Deltaproteobacteria bacterium]
MKKIAVVLSGCGVFDGSEIHEATLTLLALDLEGASYVCAAPDVPQAKVHNHLTKSDAKSETRNAAVESARIARGNLALLKDLRVSQLDGLIIPGGFGAALNLSSFATAGADMDVNPELKTLLKEFISQKKPVAALCIAPPILARVFRDLGVKGV